MAPTMTIQDTKSVQNPTFFRRIWNSFRCCRRGPIGDLHDPIYLMSADFEIIKTYEAELRFSFVFMAQLEAVGDERFAMVYYIPSVNGEILRYFTRYTAHHKNDDHKKEQARRIQEMNRIKKQKPIPSDFRKGQAKPVPGAWDKKFMESIKPQHMHPLWEMAMALDIPDLQNLILVYTAYWLRDKNDDQIRALLNIHRDIDGNEETVLHSQSVFLANGI